ncbi:CLUMA_CG002366, isoform B [Clunio marinus]|uniref:Cystinosin homolog n=1 Tax=Clunio marinus TaxID=568069 RepID=A0A1J1HKW4_9DIPT|nr:CLUMA_CG002366, isoform B [Clunio marinus]
MNLKERILLQTFAVLTVLNVVCLQDATRLSLSSNDLTLVVGETKNLSLTVDGSLNTSLTIYLYEDDGHGLISITPNQLTIPANSQSNWTQEISFFGENPGHAEIVGNATPVAVIDDSNLFVRIIVANSSSIILISFIVGWIYFVAWSISFYPQIWINIKRKSVVGLNFDFLALNLLGHTLYALFNCSLYWITTIEDEYFQRFPRGVNPVELNDVFFSIHASLITAFTISQCFIYERGEQRVSNIARGILGLFFTIIIVTFICSAVGVWHWLDFLNTCSYIKLAITLIKYVPQAVMNYRRKSTVGWSIGNIILDFTGGLLSMLQMILNSYNYNDWQSIFGDPTKFGLGLFSVLFDIVFMLQHYVFYRKSKIPPDSSRSDLTGMDAEKMEKMALALFIPPLAMIFFAFYFLRSSKEMPKNWREFVVELKIQASGTQGLAEDTIMRYWNKVELVKRPNKIAVMTGGNRGIGLCVLEKLLKCDMTVMLGGRNPEASKKSVESYLNEELIKGKVFYEKCDTGDMKSVKEFAMKVQEKFPAIHLLINNAGVMCTPYKESCDGFESQMAINYLGHFLLTHLLMPQLVVGSNNNDGRNVRIVNVSSCVHRLTDIDYSDFHCQKFYYPADAYNKSKLAQVLFTKSLERFFSEHELKIQSHSLHPGVVNTDLFEHSSTDYIPWIRKIFFKTPEEGSRTVVYAAISPKLEGDGGTYLSNCTKWNYHKSSDDPVECEKLFNFTYD